MEAKLKGKTLTFTPKEKFQSWATWHENDEGTEQIEDLNAVQGEKLTYNILAAKERLIKNTVTKHLGHVPPLKKARRYMTIVREQLKDGTWINWLWWRKTCIAAYTDPVSSVKDKRVYMTWYFKPLVK